MKNLHLKSTLSMAIAVALTACSGSGDGTNTTAGGAIGGVDIGPISSGTVSRFGSVFVNGVEFETSESGFDIDGTPGVQDDLEVGMVVDVRGSVNDDGITGTATSISFDEQIQGPVSELTVPSADGSTRVFSILGTTISISSMDTVFDITGEGTVPAGTPFGFDDIALGNNVEISGFVDSSGVLNATRVELKNVTFDETSIVEVKGNISALVNTSFNLNGLLVDAAAAIMDDLPGGLENGVLVEVKGTLNIATNTLLATEVEAEFEGGDNPDKVSIEGMVTDFVDNSSFKLNGHAVDASSAVMMPATLVLANDLRVEAEGPVVGGVLQALKLELRAGNERVHARVSAVDMVNGSLMLMPVVGQPEIEVRVTTSTEMRNSVTKNRQFALVELGVGDFVEARGFADGAGITANRIRVRENRDVIVQGVQQAGATPGFIKVLGVEFAIGATGVTSFENNNDVGITQPEFNLAVAGDVNTIIKIKDSEVTINSGIGDGIIDVVEIESLPVVVTTPPGTVPPITPPPVAILPTANFTGTAADLAGLSALFSNSSDGGRPRLDINILNLPRALIANTGDFFGDTGTGLGRQTRTINEPNPTGTIGLGDEVTVDRFSARFIDATGAVVRTFANDNANILNNVIVKGQRERDQNGDTIGARQDVVELEWSIRSVAVASLAGATRVEVMLDGTILLASAEISGDVTANDAQDVEFFNVVNSFPPVAAP